MDAFESSCFSVRALGSGDVLQIQDDGIPCSSGMT